MMTLRSKNRRITKPPTLGREVTGRQNARLENEWFVVLVQTNPHRYSIQGGAFLRGLFYRTHPQL